MMCKYSLNRLPSSEVTTKEIFTLSSCEIEDLLPSAIYHMELLDENLDDNGTILSFW